MQPFSTSEDIGSRAETLASSILGFITVIAGLAFLLYFVLGSIQWITAGGDPQQVEKAKGQMTNAGVGFVATIAAYAIAGVIGAVFGLDFLNLEDAISNLSLT